MRRVIVLLLLLPLPLISQVKILMPVVVKDASGEAVTDLKISDFQVSGPKNVRVDKMWLVQPGTTSLEIGRPPVFILYDPISTPTFQGGPHLSLASILNAVADNKLPVSVYANVGGQLRLIYDVATS